MPKIISPTNSGTSKTPTNGVNPVHGKGQGTGSKK
jgi:hypothetical protein